MANMIKQREDKKRNVDVIAFDPLFTLNMCALS